MMTASTLAARWLSAILPADPIRRLHHRIELARSRRALARLDDHLLRDIGLSRAEAEAEAAAGGWNAPLHWRG